MSSRKWTAFACTVAVALVAACRCDATTPTGPDLTTAQIQLMTTALGNLLGTSLGQLQANLSLPDHFQARWAADFQSSFSHERTCPEQGRLGISGTSTLDSLDALHLAITDTLVDCGIKDSHGDVWRFTSKPVLTTTVDAQPPVSADLEIAQTATGRVQYSSGSISGTCSIGVAVTSSIAIGSPTADSATATIHTAGTVCGRPVSRDTAITTPWGHS